MNSNDRVPNALMTKRAQSGIGDLDILALEQNVGLLQMVQMRAVDLPFQSDVVFVLCLSGDGVVQEAIEFLDGDQWR